MGKKKFIHKKQSATYRLVFKESSSATDGEGTDRVFVRVDGGDSFVPGFDPGSDEDVDEREHDGPGRGAGRISEDLRQEMLELGFPDDGYNYLQHVRDVGPSGRIGSFVPSNRVRLDTLRPDIKAFDASKVQVPSSAEESESNALCASGGARRLRGPVSKVVDSDVAALLDKEDDISLVSGDELEDDFVVLANEGVDDFSLEESASEEDDHQPSKINNQYLDAEENSEDDDYEKDHDDDRRERSTRFLDEQFELLALKEYDDDEIGELDDDDLSARGPAHISKFNNVMSDFLVNSTFMQDKYQTPAELNSCTVDSIGHPQATQSADKANESFSLCMPSADKDIILASTKLNESVSSDEEKDFVLASDSDSDEARWDCESIVTTYSNLDNHPGKICSFPKVSSKSARWTEDYQSVIRLKGKQQIPLDYLPKRGSSQVEGKNKCPNQGKTVNLVRKRTEETKDEKKARKVAIKEEKRSARASKKDMKLMYKDESQRAQRTAASTGPATLPLG
ncbi:hypothetical protein GOP47_0030308 [Adiantum capillus-veneris]|nr:hypothetical protein GOP47_0030308 [Adiantum capillus-veneris]